MQTKIHRAFVRSVAALERVRRESRQVLSLFASLNFTGCRFLSRATLLAGLALTFALPSSRGQTPNFNYAEALQKSLYFYDAQKSGPGVTGGRIEWRGDSELADTRLLLAPVARTPHGFPFGVYLSQDFINGNRVALDPDGDGYINVSGGFHDGGDHMRFGLPQAYAASTLAWSFFEFRDAFVQSGQQDHLVEELRWFADCFLRSTFRNSSGDVVAFCYDVGEPAVDHQYWGAPELQSATTYPRPAYFATAQSPASDQAAAHAAALAAIGVVLQPIDAAYSARCIETARALYRHASTHRGLGFGDVFYRSSSDDDDLAWAAVWLFQATGNTQYIADIDGVGASGEYTGFLQRIIVRPTDSWKNLSVHSWDSVWGGVFLRLAAITHNSRYLAYAQWNAEYCSGIPHQDSNDTQFIKPTPAGFRMFPRRLDELSGAACGNNCAAQLSALVLRKYTGKTEFAEWAQGQMNYIMGKNPMNRSYIVGFPTPSSAVQHPYHGASQGLMTTSPSEVSAHPHVLWGALVSGPDFADLHNDRPGEYTHNMVAVDYNASLVGALAGLYTYYGAGQKPLLGFPPAEPIDRRPYFSEVKVGLETTQTTVTVRAHAEPINPPQWERGLSARYFFDIYELIAAGQSIADVSVGSYLPAGAVASPASPTVRGPVSWDGGSVYYVEIDWSGSEIYGTRDFQFFLRAKPDAQGHSNWNAANDWSRLGVSNEFAIRPNMPIYRGGVLAYGQEPPRTLTPDYVILTRPTTLTVLRSSNIVCGISIFRTHGFEGPVSFSLSRLPTGVNATFYPPVANSNYSALNLDVLAAAWTGTIAVTLTATGAPGVRSTTFELTVDPSIAPDFALGATPSDLNVKPGFSASTAIAVSRTAGFADPLYLEVAGLPPGIWATFSPNPVTGGTSTLAIRAPIGAPLGTNTFTVSGRSATNPRLHDIRLQLNVLDPITRACSVPPTVISFPLVRDGVGEFCLVTSGTVTSINSRFMGLVEINGMNITNLFITNQPFPVLPARINGNYYIHYIANFPEAHLDISGSP